MNIITHVGITGHRPPGIGGYKQPNHTTKFVRNALYQVLLDMKNNPQSVNLRMVNGMAQGVDTIAAEVALSLHIPVDMKIVNDPGYQSCRWPSKIQKDWMSLIDKLVKDGGTVQEVKGDYFTRDRVIVNASNIAIVVMNSYCNKGGTYYTRNRLVESDTPYVHIYPDLEKMESFA